MSGRSVRSAGFADLDPVTAYLLWSFRVDVFVVEQSCPYPELDGRDTEPATRHLWIHGDGDREDGGGGGGAGPIGYLRILDDAGVARIGRVCVSTSHRGEGLAASLLEAALGEIGSAPSVLDAQAHLAGWYERFGYVASGPEFLEDAIPHVPMLRDRQLPQPPD